jgi:predicted Zn-dependent protease
MDVRPADGVREMNRELDVSPSSVPARLRLAEQYIKDENPREALRRAKEAIELDPGNSAARMVLGESLIAAGELQPGIAELERARQQTPERVRTHWDLLRAYTAAGRPEDARREKGEIEKLNAPAARP